MQNIKQQVKLIRQKIKKRGIKQKWICEQIKEHQTLLSQVLTGRRVPRNIDTLLKKIENVITHNFSKN